MASSPVNGLNVYPEGEHRPSHLISWSPPHQLTCTSVVHNELCLLTPMA